MARPSLTSVAVLALLLLAGPPSHAAAPEPLRSISDVLDLPIAEHLLRVRAHRPQARHAGALVSTGR